MSQPTPDAYVTGVRGLHRVRDRDERILREGPRAFLPRVCCGPRAVDALVRNVLHQAEHLRYDHPPHHGSWHGCGRHPFGMAATALGDGAAQQVEVWPSGAPSGHGHGLLVVTVPPFTAAVAPVRV